MLLWLYLEKVILNIWGVNGGNVRWDYMFGECFLKEIETTQQRLKNCFFWKMRGVWKASPRRIFLESIQVDFLMQTSEFLSSQVFLRRFHPPSLRSSLWPVASLLPGPWVADTWLEKCFAGACTLPKTILALWCALCLYDSMHVSSCFYPVPSMSSPSDSIPARLWSLRPRAAPRPYSHPDLHRSQRGARQQRHGLDKRGLWGELLCMRPGESWGTSGNPWGKTEKSGEKWVKRRC